MTSPRATDEATIRSHLSHTWHAFFGRFGRLTPIQRHAIGPIAAGRPVLVCSPTASGKTEATVAPLCERALESGGSGIVLLIVTPTRALANDLLRRLDSPLAAVGIRAALKTGDAGALRLSEQPMAVITTPESLDSMLCRRPLALRSVVAILLDELHLLAGTARGDQLRCLLERLDRVATAPVQRCAASATVPEPELLAQTFLGPDSEPVQSRGAAQRTIAAQLAPAADLEGAAEHIRALWAEAPGRKVLVFANSRSQVEALTSCLRARGELVSRVHAHHGSLSRGERLRVERWFKSVPSAVCVATMTLEIGIDIGDVDRVVLVAPPPNASALLQRVGRANRRDRTTHVLALYSDGFERARMEHLLECAESGRLYDDTVTFRPEVLAQQALGLTLQNPAGWVSADALHVRLPPDVARTWTRADCGQVLEQLAADRFLRPIEGGRYVADEAAARLLERGEVHSLISDSAELEVVDRMTGRTVGRARFGRAERERVASGDAVRLALGGMRREVTQVRDRSVFVDSSRTSSVEKARFIASEAPRYSAGLAADLARHLGLRPGEMPVTALGPKKYELAHFLGTAWGRVLGGLLLEAQLWKGPHRIGAFFAPLDVDPTVGSPPDGVSLATVLGRGTPDRGALQDSVVRVLSTRQKRLARLLGAGPLGGSVPEAHTDRWIAESVDVEALVERLWASRLVTAGEPEE